MNFKKQVKLVKIATVGILLSSTSIYADNINASLGNLMGVDLNNGKINANIGNVMGVDISDGKINANIGDGLSTTVNTHNGHTTRTEAIITDQTERTLTKEEKREAKFAERKARLAEKLAEKQAKREARFAKQQAKREARFAKQQAKLQAKLEKLGGMKANIGSSNSDISTSLGNNMNASISNGTIKANIGGISANIGN